MRKRREAGILLSGGGDSPSIRPVPLGTRYSAVWDRHASKVRQRLIKRAKSPPSFWRGWQRVSIFSLDLHNQKDAGSLMKHQPLQRFTQGEVSCPCNHQDNSPRNRLEERPPSLPTHKEPLTRHSHMHSKGNGPVECHNLKSHSSHQRNGRDSAGLLGVLSRSFWSAPSLGLPS